MKRFLWPNTVAMLLLLLMRCAYGQTPGTGAIAGLVYDPQNHAVSGAKVLVVNQATHLSRTVQTSDTGFYQAPMLLPGTYVVTVEVTGFAQSKSAEIEVTASETTSLNVTLALAAVGQSVRVEATAENINLESSTLGGLVDEAAVKSLPLSNRNYTQILGLSPGVIVDLPNATTLGSGTENVASDGGSPLSNNIQFNGIDANNLAENSAANAITDAGTAVPAPDTIQEFRVQTANFDAAYGRGAGANVDLVSKGGTNQFHGSAWEFLRNTDLNANEFFTKRNLQPRADLKHNQFGGTLGGPIKRDRTFFFGAYQGLIEVNGLGDAQQTVLPLLTSDRSAATLGAQFCPAGHPDSSGQPASGYFTQAGGTQVACDGSNINPVAMSILNAKFSNGKYVVPSPQVALPVTGPDPSDQLPMGQSTYTIPAHYRQDQFTANIDQVIHPRNSLAARFFYSHAPTTQAFSPNAANVPGWGTDLLNENEMFVLADTHVFNPNLVNVARFGYMRYLGDSTVENPLTAADIGMGTPTGETGPTLNMPGIQVGAFILGDAGTPALWQVTNSFIWQDTAAWTHRRHNLRFGGEVKRHQVNQNFPEETDGLLEIGTFEDFLVGQSATQNGSPQGVSNISLSFAGAGDFRRNERYTDIAGFVQDDVKVTHHFTLNAGARYEIFGAPTETNGLLANFDPNIATTGPVPAEGTYSGFTLPSSYKGAYPAGVVRTPYDTLYQTPHTDISPRLGFVWQLYDTPAVVVRGGYGIYYDRHSATIAEQTVNDPPFTLLQIVGGAPNGGASLASPFVPLVPPSAGFPIYVARTPDSTPFIEATNPNLQDSRTHEYNLNVETALGQGFLLQVGYVGTQSQHRSGQWEFDQAYLASPQNPVYGQTSNSIANVSARMPIQGIGQGSLYTDSNFIANYNALQAQLTRRMKHNLELQASYTWSKNMDEVNGEFGTDLYELQLPTNNQREIRYSSYGPAGSDRTHRFVANFTWQTPKLRTGSAPVRWLANDWQLAGIAVIQTGIPLSVFDSNAGSVYGLLPSEYRAETTGGNLYTRGSLFSRTMTGYLNSTAFTRAPEAPYGTSLADQDFGNSGVGLVRGPGQHNIDMAVERAFPIREHLSFHFRAEFFNLTNTPQFGSPNTNLGFTDPTLVNPSASSTFGLITNTVTNPRIIQFAGRILF
jgi:Carboxypeptidase regulatory-like domain/TonB dependent receptor